MAKWTAQFLRSVTSTTLAVGVLRNKASSGIRRAKLIEFVCGSDAATLGTSNFRWTFERSTSDATATEGVVSALDPSDNAAGYGTQINVTANGSLTGDVLMTIAIAEQATFRWIAIPGSEIIMAASTGAGFHFKTPVCGNTPSAAAQVTFEEL